MQGLLEDKAGGRMKSILQTRKECYITRSRQDLEEHHIFFGAGLREVSERYGFKAWLARPLHTGYLTGVHGGNRQLDMRLKMDCQRKFEESHTRDEFVQIIGRSYL